MAKPGFVWYKDPSYRVALVGIGGLGVALTVGTSLVDHEFHLVGFLATAIVLGVVTLLSYLLRNNE